MKRKAWKRTVALTTSLCLCTSCLSAALPVRAANALSEAGGERQTLPDVTDQSSAAVAELDAALKNAEGKYEDYYKVIYSGYFDLSMTHDTSGKHYDFRAYIPEGSRYSQPSIVLAVPSETDPYTFLEKSGWKAVADEVKATIFLLMPNRVMTNGTPTAWGNWSDYSANEVTEYIAAAVAAIGQRPALQTVSYCEYIIGYEDAADLVLNYVAANPSTFAGAFAVGATGTNAAAVKTAGSAESKEAGVSKNQVPLPLGLVYEDEDDVQDLISYYQGVNQTKTTASTDGRFSAYEPAADADFGRADTEAVAGVYTLEDEAKDCENTAFAKEVFQIFNRARRYNGYGNFELRAYDDVWAEVEKTDGTYQYYTSLSALGRYTYGGDIDGKEGQYYNREWLVYTPEKTKERIKNGEKVEVLFLFHGSNGYCDEIVQRMGWDTIADEEGFLIVAPSGYVRHKGNFGTFVKHGVNVYQYCTMWSNVSENTIPNDVIMVEDILDWLFQSSPYKDSVDSTKVFASGQSFGGQMTHWVAQELSDRFAAAAACSWVDPSDADVLAKTSDIAMMVLMGQKDTTVPGALSTENAQSMFDNYMARYQLTGSIAGTSQRATSWSDYTFLKEPDGGTSVCSGTTGAQNTLNTYVLSTESGVPMFTGVEVQNLTHATIPDECQYIWDNLFTKFSRSADNNALLYNGQAVSIESAKPEQTPAPSTTPAPTTSTPPASTGMAHTPRPSGSYSGYTDVPDSHWAIGDVEYVTKQGLFMGVPGGKFDPDGMMNRAMLATVLHRLNNGAGLINGKEFSDVSNDAWYAETVAWASANGILTDTGTFSPDNPATREDFVVGLYNLAKFRGENTDARGAAITSFSDASSIDETALEAASWAVGSGILEGTDGNLNLNNNITRAEMAAMLHRVVKLWEKNVSVKGMTALYNPYPKVVALVLEYPENVVAPAAEDISITDYENQLYNSANERCDFTTAQVSAVYTNNVPELRSSQKSVEGKYVIIELVDPNNLVQKDDGKYHAEYAGVSNVRYATGMKDGINTNNSMNRFDWSNYVVQIKSDVKNASGSVVCKAGTMPSMKASEISDLTGADQFKPLILKTSKGHDAYSMLYVPENYDSNKSYPMVVECSGNSQRIVLDANGEPVNFGTNLTRDTGALGWLRITDDIIILAVQPRANPIEESNYDAEDTYELIQHVRENYRVDPNRIYAVGSSLGTMHLSSVIQRHPDLFAAYVQCNGVFLDHDGEWLTMYNEASNVTGGDFANTDNYLPESEYYQAYKDVLQASIDNGLKLWVLHGRNDGSIPVTNGVSVYNMFCRLYKEAGKKSDEIADMVHLTVYENDDFLTKGVYNYHDAFRLATADREVLTWTLEQSKSNQEIVFAKKLPRAEEMTINLDDYYGQVIQGYYNFDCYVSDTVNRTAKFYVPEGIAYNNPTVFVGVPNGVDTWQFLVDSGWKTLADEKLFYVVAMEPENGKWGDTDAEIAYINALNQDVSYRPFFCAFSSNFYGVGYGEAADLLQKHSVQNPKSWAGIAVLGASGMSEEEVSTLKDTPSKVASVSLAQVQTPIWITARNRNANITRMLDFYKSANHSQNRQESVRNIPYADELYLPRKGGSVDDEWCANVIYDQAAWKDCVEEDYSESIYTNLFEGVYRYPGDANGALRRPGEIFSRGFKKFEAQIPGGFREDGKDLYNREWYVYVPESVDTSKAAPLVFVFHGAGGSGNEIADRSGWAKVAEEKGLILVCPTGSHTLSVRRVSDMVTNELFRAMWNTGDATEDRPSDLQFVEYLYDWMLDHYNIDTTRVYASGQSSGGMMTWACAAKLPEIFAAAAPVSATRAIQPDDGPLMPIMAFIGEEDSTFAGGFGSEDGQQAITYWTQRSKTVESWNNYSYMNGGKKCSFQDGLFTNYVFSNQSGVPLLRAIEVATKTHAIWPSECFMAWEEWFSNFTKDTSTGTLYYKGEAVTNN